MARVICDSVGAGLRDSERSVVVRDVRNQLHYLSVDADLLTPSGGHYWQD